MATVLSVAIAICQPPGAADASVTVQLADVPPLGLAGAHARLDTTGCAITVNVAVVVLPPYMAVIATLVVGGTSTVVTVKVWNVAPAGTSTLAGTCASEELLVSATIAPPSGAAAGKLIVAVTGSPPRTEPTPPKPMATAPIVNDAFCDAPFDEAVIVTATGDGALEVSISNVCAETPTGTVTVEGTVASGLLLTSATARPPAGAGAVNVSVPCSGCPPAATFDDSTIPCRAGTLGSVTVNDVVCETPEYVAVIVATPAAFEVAAANVWLVDPAAIVIVAGTVTAELLLVSVTAIPPVGAAADSVTVPVTVDPATVVSADIVTPDSVAVVAVAVVVEPVQAATPRAIAHRHPRTKVRII